MVRLMARSQPFITTIDLEKTYESCFFDDDTVEDIIESKKYKHSPNLFKNSIHVKFLEQFKDAEHISDEELCKSLYYKDAILSLKIYGHFRGNVTEQEVLEQTRYFLELYKAVNKGTYNKNYKEFINIGNNHSKEEYATAVKILNSNYFMVCDGHHRLACYYVSGKKFVKVKIMGIKKNNLQAWDHVNQSY